MKPCSKGKRKSDGFFTDCNAKFNQLVGCSDYEIQTTLRHSPSQMSSPFLAILAQAFHGTIRVCLLTSGGFEQTLVDGGRHCLNLPAHVL